MRILIFGDSVTQGFWDTEGGWANRIRRYYDEKVLSSQNYDLPTIFNLGVSGNTSEDLLVRFENEVKVRIYEEVAIVIAIGVNDSRIDSGINYSSPENYTKNLAELLAIAERYTKKILFVGLTPCVDSHSNPVSWDETVGYTSTNITAFDAALNEFCTQNKIKFVEILEPFTAAQSKTELLPDSLHPNNQGHQLIADLVLPKLQELIDAN